MGGSRSGNRSTNGHVRLTFKNIFIYILIHILYEFWEVVYEPSMITGTISFPKYSNLFQYHVFGAFYAFEYTLPSSHL